MCFKVIILGKDSCTYKLFLENGYEVKKVFGRVVADIIYLVWRYRKPLLTVLLLWSVLHNADYTFYNVINKGEITLAVAIVKNLDSLAFNKLIGETELCHVRATSWPINGAAPETS